MGLLHIIIPNPNIILNFAKIMCNNFYHRPVRWQMAHPKAPQKKLSFGDYASNSPLSLVVLLCDKIIDPTVAIIAVIITTIMLTSIKMSEYNRPY